VFAISRVVCHNTGRWGSCVNNGSTGDCEPEIDTRTLAEERSGKIIEVGEMAFDK
jgi:hypothetical protein